MAVFVKTVIVVNNFVFVAAECVLCVCDTEVKERRIKAYNAWCVLCCIIVDFYLPVRLGRPCSLKLVD